MRHHWRRRTTIMLIRIVLLGDSWIMILWRKWLWVIVRVVRVHVSIVQRCRRRIWLSLMTIRSSPSHILLHALPCRQMTTVHHAGLLKLIISKPTLSGWPGLEGTCRAESMLGFRDMEELFGVNFEISAH